MDMAEKKQALLADMQTTTSGLGRRTTWNECSIEEKVERLRRAVRDTVWGIQDARRCARQFEDHSHDALGNVVVRLRAKYGEDEAMGHDPLA